MQGAITILSLVTALAIAPSVAGATPPRGGSGGQAFDLDCGADAVLAGVVARTGALVDAVEALCVKVKADGSWSGGPSSKGRAGGSGGGPASLSCDAGWAVTGIHGRSGALVDRLGVRCGKLGVQGGTVKIVEGNTLRGPSGGSGGAPFDDSCPGGQVGRGLRGRAGKLVDQIELLCHTPAPPESSKVMRTIEKRLGTIERVPSTGKAGSPPQTQGPAPTITEVLRGRGWGAQGYHIDGTNFGFDRSKLQVFEGSTQVPAASVTLWSPERLSVTSRVEGSVSHRVVVDGQASNVVTFTHPPQPPPVQPRTVNVPAPGLTATGRRGQ